MKSKQILNQSSEFFSCLFKPSILLLQYSMNLCEQLDFRYLPDVKARSVSQFLCRKLICLFYNRLKTWLRNRIGEDRLPGLTLMTTSRNKIQETDSEAILNKFVLKNPVESK